MSVQKIIQEAVGQNPLGLKEALVEELRSRVALALEAKMKESDEEDEDDMDDEEDEMDNEEDDDDEMDDEEDDDKLDELNKSTLASYVKKAATSSTIAGNTMGSSRDNKEKNTAAKTIGKRLQGINRASNKLAKQ